MALSIIEKFLKPSAVNKAGYGQLRDILIMLDSSGSVGAANFADAKQQLARLVGFLCPNPGLCRHKYLQTWLC